jgi:hypothetical protein
VPATIRDMEPNPYGPPAIPSDQPESPIMVTAWRWLWERIRFYVVAWLGGAALLFWLNTCLRLLKAFWQAFN